MADETPKFKAAAPVVAPEVIPTSRVSAGGAEPTQIIKPKIVQGKAVYDTFNGEEAPKELDTSPKYKMLVNSGEFIKDQIVTEDEIKRAHPNADNWVQRGLVAKYRAPVVED